MTTPSAPIAKPVPAKAAAKPRKAAAKRGVKPGAPLPDDHTPSEGIAYETTFDGDLVDAMVGALLAEDPDARAVPYCLSGGTDQKSFSLLGIRGFGFAPLRLPADLDFSGMFHGVDERVPLDSLKFGVRVLDRFIAAS